MKKKGESKLDDDLRAEYDFYKLKGGVEVNMQSSIMKVLI